jgi:hypothetical protein
VSAFNSQHIPYNQPSKMDPVIRALAEAIFPPLDATDCGPEVALYNRLSGADQPQVVTHVSWLGCSFSRCGTTSCECMECKRLHANPIDEVPPHMHAAASFVMGWLAVAVGPPYQVSLTQTCKCMGCMGLQITGLWPGRLGPYRWNPHMVGCLLLHCSV